VKRTLTLGEALRQTRENAGLSLRDVERLTGMSTSQISQLETGQRPDPALSTIVKLASGLRVSIDALVAACSSGSIPQPELSPSQRDQLTFLGEIEIAHGTAEKLTAKLGALLQKKHVKPSAKNGKRKK
jgi:transcriptional regulator with XRE-family HTH domain